MGCVSSREARLDRLRSSPSYGRSVSMPVVHGSNRKGDSLHVVSLTSSTIGFLKLSRSQESSDEEMMKVNSEGRDQKTPETIGGGAGAGAGVNKPTLPESEDYQRLGAHGGPRGGGSRSASPSNLPLQPRKILLLRPPERFPGATSGEV
ncbi:hypothetical protein KSP40_PGU008823 [Platanthera guangdongensis]|uniref:Uncharacterized protein n=1 Tax=Platanthera guangdongensis TaxID=2320717 RepID=A0ABR2MQU4_9ASPA